MDTFQENHDTQFPTCIDKLSLQILPSTEQGWKGFIETVVQDDTLQNCTLLT